MECDELKSSIVNWFGNEIECHGTANSFTAVLPLLQPNGDSVELGITVLGESEWRISDLGHTHETLYLGGIELSEESDRSDQFERLVGNHGLTDRDNELSRVVSGGDFLADLFDFVSVLQSMLSLQFTVRTTQPTRDFAAIVAKFLAEQRAQFDIPPEPIEGLTGRWKFNFALNHVAPATYVKALTASSPSQAMTVTERSVFEIKDVQAIQQGLRSVVIIDDEGEREPFWKPKMRRVFDGYSVPVIGYVAQREQLIRLAEQYRR
jgi:uncharacterized protein DUF1828